MLMARLVTTGQGSFSPVSPLFLPWFLLCSGVGDMS